MPEEEQVRVPHFRIELDGREVSSDIMSTVESVECEDEINTASMFILRLSISDFGAGAWRYLDLENFRLGSEIKISMGMDRVEQMIAGEITSLEPSFGDGLSIIEIRGFDRLHRLRFGNKKRTFAGVADSDIAAAIAREWDLSPEVEDTGTIYQNIYQNNQSDLEFLLDRAKRIRYEVKVNDRTLYFRSARENEASALTLEYRVNLNEFSAKLSARHEGSEFVVQGWDFMRKEPISGRAQERHGISSMSASETGMAMIRSAFTETSSSTIVGENPVDTADAEKLAIARYNEQLVEFVTGEGKCPGIPGLRAGKNIEVRNVGRFSGIYYVTSTTHSIDKNGYSTAFKVRRVGV